MADIVNAISKATDSFLNINTITVDNCTFKLFYKWTVTLLVACSVLVGSKQLFGGPITCDAGAVQPNKLLWSRPDFEPCLFVHVQVKMLGSFIKKSN